MRRLWYHGKVDTMVPGKDRQQAIGVEDGTIVFVGSDRECYDWRSMLELGLAVSGGSDCPVEPFDVLDNLRAAVTRQDRAGERTYLPEQALSLEEGLSLFTSRAAWASRDEDVRGRLMPGMQGDLVILDGDLFAVLPQELPKVLVFETVLAGETVFAKKV